MQMNNGLTVFGIDGVREVNNNAKLITFTVFCEFHTFNIYERFFRPSDNSHLRRRLCIFNIRFEKGIMERLLLTEPCYAIAAVVVCQSNLWITPYNMVIWHVSGLITHFISRCLWKKSHFFPSESDNRPMRLTHLSKYTRFSATGGTFLGMHYAELSIFVAFFVNLLCYWPEHKPLGY